MGTALRVGVVGLGRIGEPVAANIAAAGFEVRGFDIAAEARERAARAGVEVAQSAAACAAASDVLITLLPTHAEVEQVLLGAGDALAALPAGAIAVDMSTSSPELARRIAAAAAARGVGALDAPVANASAVARGGLHVLAGGERAHLDRVRPVLHAVAERVFHLGGSGSGQVTKLLANLLWFEHAAATTEALLVGVRSGIGLRALHEALAAGPGGSHFLGNEALEVLERGDYADRFPLALVVQELELALGLAREAGIDAELAALTDRLYRRALARYGDATGELSAVRLLEDEAGTALRFADEHPAAPRA